MLIVLECVQRINSIKYPITSPNRNLQELFSLAGDDLAFSKREFPVDMFAAIRPTAMGGKKKILHCVLNLTTLRVTKTVLILLTYCDLFTLTTGI